MAQPNLIEKRIKIDPKIGTLPDQCFRCWKRLSVTNTQVTCPKRGHGRDYFCQYCGPRNETLDTCDNRLKIMFRWIGSRSRRRVQFEEPREQSRSAAPRRTVIVWSRSQTRPPPGEITIEEEEEHEAPFQSVTTKISVPVQQGDSREQPRPIATTTSRSQTRPTATIRSDALERMESEMQKP